MSRREGLSVSIIEMHLPASRIDSVTRIIRSGGIGDRTPAIFASLGELAPPEIGKKVVVDTTQSLTPEVLLAEVERVAGRRRTRPSY